MPPFQVITPLSSPSLDFTEIYAYDLGPEGTSGSSWHACHATSFMLPSCTFSHFLIKTVVHPMDSTDTDTDTRVWGAPVT